MTEKKTLNKEAFVHWKNDDVTKQVFLAIEDFRKDVEDSLLSSSLILRQDSKNEMCRLVGLREGLDFLLNISVEEVE